MDTSHRKDNATPMVAAIVDIHALIKIMAFTERANINAVAGGPIIQPVTKIAPTVWKDATVVKEVNVISP